MILRSINRGENNSNELNGYCTKIHDQEAFHNPLIPQQNDVVEKKIRTIHEMVRCMLLNLLSFLWG